MTAGAVPGAEADGRFCAAFDQSIHFAAVLDLEGGILECWRARRKADRPFSFQ